MISNSPFPLIKYQQTSTNINSQYDLTAQVQYDLSNGNTQFAIDLSRQLKLSYSIPSIALQIAARFFHLRCYVNYDRFMILLASLILAFKMKYMEIRFKDVLFAYYRIITFRCRVLDPFDEKMLNRFKDEVCIAENEILRTLEYDIDVQNPHDFLKTISDITFSAENKHPREDKAKYTTRIIILDSNRVQTSLYFSAFTIAVSSFLIACRYEGIKPYVLYQSNKKKQSQRERQIQTKKQGDVNEEQLYAEWLQQIGKKQNEKISQQSVLSCIKHMNKIMELMERHKP